MSIQERTIDGAPEWFNSDTHETIQRVAPLAWIDDFRRHKDFIISRDRREVQDLIEDVVHLWNAPAPDDGLPWDTVETDTGAPIEVVTDAEGYVKLSVSAANWAQLAALYWADNCILPGTNELVFEARIQVPALPTGEGGELTTVIIGLAGEHNTTADSIAQSAWFRLNGSGEVWIESDDGTTDAGPTQTGVTLGTTGWYVLRLTLRSGVAIFTINDVVVGTTSIAALTTATGLFQPYFRVSKTKTTSNTTAATLYVDYCKVWAARN